MEVLIRLYRFANLHRRGIAAVLAGLAALILVLHLNPRLQPGVPVVVTTGELQAGRAITASDVTVVEWPRHTLPTDPVTSTDDVVGLTPTTSVGAHTVLQPGLISNGPRTGSGRSLVPVTLFDERIIELMSPGDPLALVAVTKSGADILTDDVRLAAMPVTSTGSSLSPTSGRNPMVLVDVPANLAPEVAILGQRGELSLILISR